MHGAVSRALDLCCTASTSRSLAPPRLSMLRDCNDGSVQLSLWLPYALQPESVQFAPRALQIDWVKLQVHDGSATRTYVLLDSSGEHDLPISSRVIADDEESEAWTAMSWRITSEHDEDELRAALVATVESFWLDSCPDLELHMADNVGTGKFSLWQPPDFSRKSHGHVEPPADETTLLQAVHRAGSAAARYSRRACAEATTVSGWRFTPGNSAVQCCMHWSPDCPAAAAAHADSEEPSSIVRLLTDESFRVGDIGSTPVHDAFAAVAKTWAKEFAMELKIAPRSTLDHTSYCFELPVVRGQPPVSGVLTVAIDSPTGNIAAGSAGTAYVRAAQYAVGQAVDALASRDILFLSQRRLRRQQYAPAIAQKLSWMLCKIGDEAILNECASALGVEYDQLAADTRAIATSHQHRDQLTAASAAAGSNGEDDNMASDAENTPHARVVSNIAAGLATQLCAQLREACPAAPDANKVASACRLRSHSKSASPPPADDFWEGLSQKRKAGACGVRSDALSDQEVSQCDQGDTQQSSEATLSLNSLRTVATINCAPSNNLQGQLELHSDRHPNSQQPVGAGTAADEATDIESEWSDSATSDADGFESDDWTDSEPLALAEGDNHWSDDEDQKLLEAARAHGFTDGSDGGAAWSPDWGTIAAQMDTRSPEQCRRRFTDYLDPTIDHSSLTEKEEQLLVQLVETHGTKWSAISSEMPQTNGRRTGVQLSNTWRRVMGKQQERRPTKALDDAASLEKDGQPEASTAAAEPLGHRPSTAAAVQPSSATDGFESDDWSDSEPMPMSTDAGVADAAGVFEPDDWSGSESDLSTSALNDQRESESEAEEGSAHLVFGEANWHAADVGSDFSSTDSDEDQCDP